MVLREERLLPKCVLPQVLGESGAGTDETQRLLQFLLRLLRL